MENGTLSDHQGLCGHGGCGSDPRRSEWCLAVKAEGQVTTGLDDQHLPRGPMSPPQPTRDGDEMRPDPLPPRPAAISPLAPPPNRPDSTSRAPSRQCSRKDNTEERENKRSHEEWS
ncbi:unnamed protein product [Arctogadus glacialis]